MAEVAQLQLGGWGLGWLGHSGRRKCPHACQKMLLPTKRPLLFLMQDFTLSLSSPAFPPAPLPPRRSSLSHFERTTVEGQLNEFDIALGSCERISRQAIPMAYTR